MKKKILFVAHMDSHIANFHLPYLKWFQEQGYETHVASNDLEKTRDILYCDVKHQIDFLRSPFSLKNLKVYRTFKKMVKEHDFSLVHAHTPMGGLFARLAFRKSNTPVIYTAHGFHFLKGGSILSWLIFYPIEKFLSKYTNEIITINQEDFSLAKNKFSKKCKISYVPGVGVDLKDYYLIDESKKIKARESLGIKSDDFVLVYVAELTKGKNQGFLIKAINVLKDKYPNLKLLLVGYGKETDNYKKLVEKYKLDNEVKILGYRTDIVELNNIADVVVSASLREGLPKGLLEALSVGKPLLVSNIRGNNDTVINDVNGYLYEANNLNMFTYYFEKLYLDKKLRDNFSKESIKIANKFDINKVLEQVSTIYNNYIKEEQKIWRKI